MDTSVSGLSNTVPDHPTWLIWNVCSYNIYGECVRSRIAKIFSNMLPGTREPIDAMRQWGEKVNFTLVRDRGVEV